MIFYWSANLSQINAFSPFLLLGLGFFAIGWVMLLAHRSWLRSLSALIVMFSGLCLTLVTFVKFHATQGRWNTAEGGLLVSLILILLGLLLGLFGLSLAWADARNSSAIPSPEHNVESEPS